MMFSTGGNAAFVIASLAVGAVGSYLVTYPWRRSVSRSWFLGGLVSVLAYGTALYFVFTPYKEWNYLAFDGLGRFVAIIALPLGAVVSVYSMRYMRESDGAGRYYGLLLLMSIGVMGVVSARDTIGLYLFFELMSVSSYSLVSFRKDQWAPVEAGLKYVMLNATGSSLALLGISLAYLYRDSTLLGSVGWVLRTQGAHFLSPGALALAFTVAGMGVKSAMVPFHTWLPDAYASAPAGVSAMLSGIVTEMGFVAMLRLVLGEFSQGYEVFGYVLVFMALVTMTVGNLGALGQRDIKKMLGYSSIAQMGYMMAGMGLGLGLGVSDGIRGSLFHIMTHSAMKAGAFLAAGLLIDNIGSRSIDDMRGAGQKYPLIGSVLAISALSLAGIPGFAGFMSKLWIYRAGLESGQRLGWLVSTVAIGNSVLSLGYYLPLLFVLFRRTEDSREREVALTTEGQLPPAGTVLASTRTPWELLPVLLLGVAVMVLGSYPVPVLDALESAAATLAFLGGL
ncbi:MAG: NADH-quinone oxidoreductase subunit N [Candidatus Fermentithermobacillus carboniphilus]|uniref:NADH-quinone oxidoreductase subunit N n=1 Tax=Candidatus Fermentithermobacillus carboniphilus TaxID=3085328 RepID=A0AAT9LAE1_9FIRM|nr:MAG: NADH-quinone oxidoreductase subunit N [Candidatus Fermentithermobacillus carboniphilus]